jgi:hypothetical protein
VSQLRRTLSAAASSPWLWPVLPLLAIAAAGQWGSVLAAEAVAGAFGTVIIGIAIGLTLAGRPVIPKRPKQQPPDQSPKGLPDAASPTGPPNPTRAADLRGARLTNTTLVRADLRCVDLREADLRGAVLTEADLSGADLTGARLGPLDDDSPAQGPTP